MRIIELFAGIGACSTALKRIGIDLEIADAVEIDKYAMASFNAIHGTNFKPQDITTWNKDLKDIDLITHGSPCQDFSVAGKQAGGDLGSGTRSSLMYETIRIVGQVRPKYVLWENVKNLLSKKHKHNFDAYIETMNVLGYNSYYQVLNAKDYGIPQNRERVYTISIRKDIDNGNFKFPEKEELKLRLKDMLEDEVDEKYYLDDAKIEKITNSNFMQEKKRTQEKEYSDTILARDWKDPKCVRIGGIFDTDKSKHQAGSIYDKEGLSPTLDVAQGGWRQPSILEDGFIERKYNNFIKEKGYVPEMFNPYHESEIKEIAPTQSTQCGSMTSSATVLIKNATKKGYDEAVDGDSVNLQYPDSNTRHGRVGHQVSQTIQCNDSMGVVEKADRVYSGEGISPTIHTCQGGNTEPKVIKRTPLKFLNRNQKNIEGDYAFCVDSSNTGGIKEIEKDNYRIRKLTPKECWRLMGFNDEDFEKAQNIPTSNTQLYKQAGNSIVVNVLEKIFKNLFNI